MQTDRTGLFTRTCPVCFGETHSLKVYRITRIYCFFLFIQWQRETVRACPGCMRAYLTRWGLTQLLAANFFWPVLVLPHLLFRLLATFKRGHAVPNPSIMMGCLLAAVWFSGLFLVFQAFSVLILTSEGKMNDGFLPVIGVSLVVGALVYGLFCWLAASAEISR